MIQPKQHVVPDFTMIENAIRKFAQENFSHKYHPVLHGETDKIQPLALAVKQRRPIWKRPFAKWEIVIFAGFDRYVGNGVQKTVCESITSNIRHEELSVKQEIESGTRDNASCDDQAVLALGKLSQKYIDDRDLREILANAELDGNKMKTFAEYDELLLITSVIYSEKFELKGQRMQQKEVAAEVRNLPPSLQFLNLNRKSPLKIHYGDMYFPPDAAARNSQAPILLKSCRVDYNKEANRLETCKEQKVVQICLHRYTCCCEEDDEDGDTLVETTDQTDLPDCFTAKDIETLDKLIRVVLLPETTRARRKARVSKYLHWFEKALMTDQKRLTLDERMTLEDCDFLKSLFLPYAQDSIRLDLRSLSTEDTQKIGFAFKVLDDLSDEQWGEMEMHLTANTEY